MKKLLAGLVTSLVTAAALVVPAGAAPKQQHVEGSIALRAPFANQEEQLQSCYAGVQRRLHLITQGNANGIVGYHFKVDKATWNKPFKLDVTAGQVSPDMDLTYYLDGKIGSLDDHLASPPWGTDVTPWTVNFEERQPGGEAGIVPKGATDAIVCMFEGYAADFMYMAGAGVK